MDKRCVLQAGAGKECAPDGEACACVECPSEEKRQMGFKGKISARRAY